MGERATTIAREAIERWLDEKEKEQLHSNIVAFAEKAGGTEYDLDRDVEQAGLEALDK